jgi:hypothetical protein
MKHEIRQPNPLRAQLIQAVQRFRDEDNRPTKEAAQSSWRNSDLARYMDVGPSYPVLSCVCRCPAMSPTPLQGALLSTWFSSVELILNMARVIHAKR